MSQGYGGAPPPGGPPGGWGGGGWQPQQPGAAPQPPAGGYGAPPGQAYGAPPAANYGAPPPGGGGGGYSPAGGGGRVVFTGDGGKLLVNFLMYAFAPIFVGLIALFGSQLMGGLIGSATSRSRGAGAAIGGGLAMVMLLVGLLLYMAGYLAAIFLFPYKLNEFQTNNTTIDGKPLNYTATLGEHIKFTLLNTILTQCTFGIYLPWALVAQRKFWCEKTTVGGESNKLSFDGDGGQFFGIFLLNYVLIMCTGGIYFPWAVNNFFEYFWTNTKIDGRPFGFHKDPGSLFGTYLLNLLLTYCTMGIYTPWMICNIKKWESEHVT